MRECVRSLRLAREEASRYKLQLDRVGEYERQVDRLKGEISLLRQERDILESRSVFACVSRNASTFLIACINFT